MTDAARGVVVGVGVASAATPAEVADLVAAALAEVGRVPADVTAVATVTTRRHHPAIVALGLPVVAFTPAELAEQADAGTDAEAKSGQAEDHGPVRPAVAEPAALRAAAATATGGPATGTSVAGAVLLVPKRRSARATVAVAGRPAG